MKRASSKPNTRSATPARRRAAVEIMESNPTPPLPQPVARPSGDAATRRTKRGDLGTLKPQWLEIWLDARHGDDANQGTRADSPVRSFERAWQIGSQMPADAPLNINLQPGTYTPPHFLQGWLGTAKATKVIQGVKGKESVTIAAGLNIKGARHLRLENLTIDAGGDHPNHYDNVVHLENCHNVTIQHCDIGGDKGSIKEVVKVNQCRYLTISNNAISDCSQTAVDVMACQHVTVAGNEIFSAGSYGAYAKGGSHDVEISGNEIYDCGMGIAAGEGSGLQFLVPPFFYYEATGVRVEHNKLTNIAGTGLAAFGAFNALFNRNTLVNVADPRSQQGVFTVGYGTRTCSGEPEKCAAYIAEGAWGSAELGRSILIPSHSVWFYNNEVHNELATRWGHFRVDKPEGKLSVTKNLRIKGNIVWDGGANHTLWATGDPGASSASTVLVRSQNVFDLDPLNLGARKKPRKWAVPKRSWKDAPAAIRLEVGK